MSHEIDCTTGRAAFVFTGDRREIWHSHGTVIAKGVTWREAVAIASIPTVHTERVFTRAGIECEGVRAIVRDDTGAFLATVSDRYSVIQYADAFAVMDRIAGLSLSTMGALKGGKIAFACANLPDDVIAGDLHRRFLYVESGHDRMHAFNVYLTSTRVVCDNTRRASRSDALGSMYVLHRGDTDRKIAAAGDVMQTILAGFDADKAVLESLSAREMTASRAVDIMTELFPRTAADIADKRPVSEAASKALHLARYGKGNERHAGTAYALLQGVTDYLDHHTRAARSKSAERRFSNAVSGTATVKAKALALIAA